MLDRSELAGRIPRAVASLVIAFLANACTEPVPGGGVSSAPKTRAEKIQALETLRLQGPSLSSFDDGSSTHFTASGFVIRKRSALAGLGVYHDLRELFVRDAAFGIDSERVLSFGEMLTQSLGPVVEVGQSAMIDSASSDANSLTRVLFDHFELTQRKASLAIKLSARKARYDIANRALVLDGNVELVVGSSPTVSGPQAVLFDEHPGLFFPLGRILAGERTGSSMFLVDATGRLSATKDGPPMSYDDLVDRRERAVLEKVVHRAPPSLRPLLLAVLAQSGSRAP